MKIKIFLFVVLLSLNFVLKSQNSGTIVINISDIPTDNGQIIVKLYDSEKTYRKIVYKRATSTINNNEAKIIFNNVPSGSYCFAVVHDENTNNEIDFNFLGIPSENVAASNNAKGFMVPPSFDNAKFEVTNATVIQNIEM